MGAPLRAPALEAGSGLPELHGLELPAPGPLRRLAWLELHAAASRKAEAWPRLVLEDGASHVVVKRLELVEGAVRRVLGIKASPPLYRAMVDDLAGILVTGWGVSESLVLDAADDLAKLGDQAKSGKAWKRAAKRRIDQLQADLAAAGVKVTRGRLAESYTKVLAASFLLGQTETTRPIGWEAAFSLVDQDAVAGLSRSGLWWIGNHYGQALDSGKLLSEVEGMIRDGMGRKDGGRRLREAFGREFHRSDAYWRGLAATVATRSRSFGALSGMEATGATVYEYVNPLDERTSPVCERLDGTRFSVKGGIELRERLVGADPAQDPEAWKAISPWPRVKDLDGPDGALLSPGELQAKGIAWPPLHFHCRSSIDVVSWATIRPEDLDGPGAVERAGPRPKPPPAKGKPSRKPPATPRQASPWDQAKADLAAAEDRARALGLDPERAGLSKATAREVVAWRQTTAKSPSAPRGPFGFHAEPSISRAVGLPSTDLTKAPTGAMVRLAETMEGQVLHNYDRQAELVRMIKGRQALGHYVAPGELEAAERHLAEVAKFYTNPALARKVRAEVEALRDVQAAYRRAVELAPVDVREAWRLEQTRKVLGDAIPKGWPRAQREAAELAAMDSLRTYPVDWLRLYHLEGESVVHNARENRAYASPASFGGSITMNLGSLTRKTASGAWEPVYYGRQPGTLSHELGHRFDGIFGGWGYTGQAWLPRSDYPEAADLWRSTLGDTYRGAWVTMKSGASKGESKIVKLPWNEPHSKYQRAGTYVDPYEARIYAGGKRKPTRDQIGEYGTPSGRAGGPIEFTAMAVQYVQEAGGQTMRRALERRASSGAVESMARSYMKAMASWDPRTGRLVATAGRDQLSRLVRGRALYGPGYRDGLEAMTGAGLRAVRRQAELGALSFTGDHDVEAFALLVRFHHGTRLEDLVGPGGPLSGYLGSPVSSKRLAELERAAGYLDSTGAGDLGEVYSDLFDLTRSSASFESGLGDLIALAEDAAP